MARKSAEYRSFRENFVVLFEGIQDPVTLSMRLFAAGLLSPETRRTICSLVIPAQQRNELLNAVEGQIIVDPQNFYKFVDKLEEDRSMQQLCHKLRSLAQNIREQDPELVPAQDPQHFPEHSPQHGSQHESGPEHNPEHHPRHGPQYSRGELEVVVLFLFFGFWCLYLLWLGSPSPNILHHEPVTSYAKYLKFRYRKPLPDDDRILKSTGKIYIELAVIRNENISREEADEFTKKSLHGLTEEILQKKTPVALEDILKPGDDGRPVRRVLVEGAPGVGKSVFAWQLCHKWAHKLENLKHFDLVVLAQLRGKRAQEAKHLSDLFPLSKNNSIEQVIAEIGNGQNILIILDGFDELPREQRQEGSVYIDLIKDQELLPEATVIITSRPSVSAYIMKYSIDRRLEILGFTEAKIVEFAKSVDFSDATCQTKFLEYINGNPVIKGMMYLPLNAFFVASIFELNYRTNSPYPKTITQLYDALIRSLIRRHLGVADNYSMPMSLMCREDINELDPVERDKLLVIARKAYEGLCDEKYVFTDLDGSKFDHLGMMKKTTSLDDTAVGPTYTFSFLHLTLQEYLSALHLSLGQSLIDGRNIALRLLSWMWSLCICFFWHGSNSDIPHLVFQRDIVMRFLAGLCKHSSTFSCQRVGDLVISNDIERSSAMIDVTNYIQVVRCVHESVDIVLESREMQNLLISNEMISVWGQSPFDGYLIGHCISHHGGVWHVNIDNKDEFDLLVQGLKSFNGNRRGKLQKLVISDIVLLILDQVLLSDLQQLQFQDVEFTANSVTVLQEYISSGSLKFIHVLDCENVEPLLLSFFQPSSLEFLGLVGVERIFHIDDDTLNLLIGNPNLNQLRLRFTLELTSTLCENPSLERLVNQLLMLIKLIKLNHNLQKINIEIDTHDDSFNEFHVKLLHNKETHSSEPKIEVKLMQKTCDYNATQQLLLCIPEQYHSLLHIVY